MQLTQCRDQKRPPTLEAYFAELGDSIAPSMRAACRVMQDLVVRLRALPNDWCVYGLTSHYRLCLLSVDSYDSPWWVTIAALNAQSIAVDYLVPAHMAPWPGARTCGQAQSTEAAVSMIQIAMEASGGWTLSRS